MADTSPGKVQALTAMFAQKNEPIMGIYRQPSGMKLRNASWTRAQSDCTPTKCTSIDEESTSPDTKTGKTISPLKLKVLPSLIKPKTELNTIQNGKSKVNNAPLYDTSAKPNARPSIGPKPSLSQSSSQTSSSSSLHLISNSVTSDKSLNGNCPIENTSEHLDSKRSAECDYSKMPSRPWAVGETIASFMFTGNVSSLKANNHLNSEVKNGDDQSNLPVPTPRKSIRNTTAASNTELLNKSNDSSDIKDNFRDPYSNIINSDNYICKSNGKFRRKALPSKEKLGQPPLKPIKPLHMTLPSQYNDKVFQTSLTPMKPVPVQLRSLLTSTPQRPTYPCPPRPTTTPPPRPPYAPPSPFVHSNNSEYEESQSSCRISMLTEIEELYEDTLLDEKSQRPVSLIPEYTEEEEQAETDMEELYDDAGDTGDDRNNFNITQYPTKPKNPPPPPPSGIETSMNYSSDELYQDAIDPGDENDEFYEVMPVDYLPQEEHDCPLYSNNRKEIEKLRREEEKKIRKELKEREKKEKEREKLKKKFGLTGEEIPIDAGLVKSDCRGGRTDLPVRRGETVLILRMESNPSGKWLVKNERGKIGYVELTNIEVDPDSVKSVMSIRRTSVMSEREELYCEAASEEEAIYETTY